MTVLRVTDNAEYYVQRNVLTVSGLSMARLLIANGTRQIIVRMGANCTNGTIAKIPKLYNT